MLIKVCGMRERENIAKLAHLRIDLMGLIFYEKSPRFVEADGPKDFLKEPIYGVSDIIEIPKVGVFVNADVEYIERKAREYNLAYIQLHGHENLFYCQKLKKKGFRLIKAFSVDADFNFTITEGYHYLCDYFIFDTKGDAPGGNGVPFNWGLLAGYQGVTPFLLGGGIGPESVTALRNFAHPRWAGIDLNSRFETEPGKKEIWLLHRFIEDLRDARVLQTKLPNWD